MFRIFEEVAQVDNSVCLCARVPHTSVIMSEAQQGAQLILNNENNIREYQHRIQNTYNLYC